MHKCVDIDSLKDELRTNNSLVSIFNSKDDRSCSSEAYQNHYEKSNIRNGMQHNENKYLNEFNIQKRYRDRDDRYMHYSSRMHKEKTNHFDWNQNKIDVHPNSNYDYNHNKAIPEYSYQNKFMNYEKSSSDNMSRHFDEINDTRLAKKHIKHEYKYNEDIDDDINENNDLFINMVNNHYKNLIADTNKGIKNITNNYDTILQKINNDDISSSTSSIKNNNLKNNSKNPNNAYYNNHINSNNSILHIRNYYTNNQTGNYKGNHFDIDECYDIDDCYENDNPYNNNNNNKSIPKKDYPVYKGIVANKNNDYVKESKTKIILKENDELCLVDDEKKDNQKISNTNNNRKNAANSNRNKIYNVFNNMNINKSNNMNRGILTFLENKRKNRYSYDSKGIKNDKTEDDNNEDAIGNISNIGGACDPSNYINNTCVNDNKKYYQDSKNCNLNMKHLFDEGSYYRDIMEKQSMHNNENKKGNDVSEYRFNEIYYKDKRGEKGLKDNLKNKSNNISCENLKFLDKEDYKNNIYINLLNQEIKDHQTQLNISKNENNIKMKENNPFVMSNYVKKNIIKMTHDFDHPNLPDNYANPMRTNNFDNHHNITNYGNNNHNNMENYVDNYADDKNYKFDGKNVNFSNANGKSGVSMRFSNILKNAPEIQNIQNSNYNAYSINKLKLESLDQYQNMYINNKNTMKNDTSYKKGVINEDNCRSNAILKGVPSSAFEHNEKKKGKGNEIGNRNDNIEKREDFKNREKIQLGEELPNDINSSYYATSSNASTNYFLGSKNKLNDLHNCKNMKDTNCDNKHILRNKNSNIKKLFSRNNSINDNYSQNKKIKNTNLKSCIDEYIASKDPHNLRNICNNKDNESNNLNLNENYVKSTKKKYNLNSDSCYNNNSNNEAYPGKSKNTNYFNDNDKHTPKYSKIPTDRKPQNMHSSNSNHSDEKKKKKEKCQKNKNKIIKQYQGNDNAKIADINQNTENLISIDKGNYHTHINRKKNRENQNTKQSNEKAHTENKRELNIGECHEDHIKNKSSKFINIFNASRNMRNADKDHNYNYSMDDIKYIKLNIAKEQKHIYSNACSESNEEENHNCTKQNEINKIHNKSIKKRHSDIYEHWNLINNLKYNDEQNSDDYSSSFNDNEKSKQKKTYDAINPKNTQLNKDQLNNNIKNNVSRTYPICDAFLGSSNVRKNGMTKQKVVNKNKEKKKSKIKNDTNCKSINSAYDNNNEDDNISIQNEAYILTNLKNGKTKKNKEHAQQIKLEQFAKKKNGEIKTDYTQNIVHGEENKNNAHGNVAVSVYNEKQGNNKISDDHIEDYKKHKKRNDPNNTQTQHFENNPFYLYYNKRSETTSTEIKIQKTCPNKNSKTQIEKKKKNLLNKLWNTVQSENKDNDENDAIPSNNSNINGGKYSFYNFFCKKNKLRKDKKYNDDQIDVKPKNQKHEICENNNDPSNDYINKQNNNYMNDLNKIGYLAQEFMETYSCNDNLKSIFQLLRSEIEKTQKEIEHFSKDQKPITFNNPLSNNLSHTYNKISDISKESLNEYISDQTNSKSIHNIPKYMSNDLVHIKEKQNPQNGNNDKHEHYYQIIKSTHHDLYKNKGSISSSSRRSSISRRRNGNSSAHKDNIDCNDTFNMSSCMLKRVKSGKPYKLRIKKKRGSNDAKENIIPKMNTFILKHNNNIYKFKLNNNFLIYDSILLKNKKNEYFFNFNALYKTLFFKESCNEEKVEYKKSSVYKNNMIEYNNQDILKNNQQINHPNNTLDKGICMETHNDTPTNLNDLFISDDE
ncbi:conserved Plasmodium protein, unknown function [Plasmodium vinckei vinckei]|uniref:Uncharacterized protein n=1 Tax=Plasmodium vinckei vinckei TaxID=54757 RepID=A0A449BXJ8_PLAVN|nr:conserved Plasmodium protein, unknown function [Plasmodium vinckei vinckei]KEG04493.1 hypothetical protein YYE_00068 [Plasmodium vinckei vinckei]VEV58143.1 conserved Plasmodium protein, unknown function [Plasmodium vinckei vinckei]